jgi:hypothetical protein
MRRIIDSDSRREALMAGKPEILRALDGLQEDSLKEVNAFIDSLKT